MFSSRQSFIKGAIIISAGGFLSKLLGAVYRIALGRGIQNTSYKLSGR